MPLQDYDTRTKHLRIWTCVILRSTAPEIQPNTTIECFNIELRTIGNFEIHLQYLNLLMLLYTLLHTYFLLPTAIIRSRAVTSVDSPAIGAIIEAKGFLSIL